MSNDVTSLIHTGFGVKYLADSDTVKALPYTWCFAALTVVETPDKK